MDSTKYKWLYRDFVRLVVLKLRRACDAMSLYVLAWEDKPVGYPRSDLGRGCMHWTYYLEYLDDSIANAEMFQNILARKLELNLVKQEKTLWDHNLNTRHYKIKQFQKLEKIISRLIYKRHYLLICQETFYYRLSYKNVLKINRNYITRAEEASHRPNYSISETIRLQDDDGHRSVDYLWKL